MGRRHILLIPVLISILTAALACPPLHAQISASATAPYFTAAGVVQAATQTSKALAPNTIATIYGTNLSWTTHAVTIADLNDGALPTTLDEVSVTVEGILCRLFFISPGQINFLIPYELTKPLVSVLVLRQGIGGPTLPDGSPSVIIPLATTSPGFFQWNGNFAVAEHADGSLITPSAPAQASEVIVLYAAGLGRTVPDSSSGSVVLSAATILYASQMQILLNGVPCPQSNIYYAGVTPGFVGLYQINLRLPAILPPNPQIQIVMGAQSSPAAIQLFAN